MNVHVIHNESAESLTVVLKVTPDPTGSTPQFALSAHGTTDPGSFSNGTLGTWSTSTKRVTCTTPTIGGAGTLQIAAGSRYHLWYKLVVGGETFVDICADIVCPG
jgi:hypothetical protein